MGRWVSVYLVGIIALFHDSEFRHFWPNVIFIAKKKKNYDRIKK